MSERRIPCPKCGKPAVVRGDTPFGGSVRVAVCKGRELTGVVGSDAPWVGKDEPGRLEKLEAMAERAEFLARPPQVRYGEAE